MQIKKTLVVLMGVLISITAFAEPDHQKNINIAINPDMARTITTHHRDTRLKVLREQANQQSEKGARIANKSYISMAPDPNDPNYWKGKKTDNRTQGINSTSSTHHFVSEQQLQRQTTALQQMLTRIKTTKETKVTVVSFKNPVPKSVSLRSGTSHEQQAITLPGTMWYGTMSSGADSYVPGPVTATIQEGSFAGARVLGQFEVAPDGEHLILTFNNLSFQGKSFGILAVAMDPNTRISGITGDIDHHIFTRFIIPGAASFLENVTQALMSQQQSVVSNPAGIVVTSPKLSNTQLALMGAGGAAKSFARATRPTGVMRLPEVKIRSGQGIGLLIIKPIV